MRHAPPLHLGASDRRGLEELAATGPLRAKSQAKSLLFSSQGMSNDEIARTLGVSSNTVRAWRRLFERDGLDGLGTIAKGRGRKRTLSDEVVAEVVRLTLDQSPAGPSSRWSTRSLARRLGISKDSVARIWAERGITPDQGAQPRLDHSGLFERALAEPVALYLGPPLSVAVFSVRRASAEELDGSAAPAQPSVPGGSLAASPAVHTIETLLAQGPPPEVQEQHRKHSSTLPPLEALSQRAGPGDLHVLVLDGGTEPGGDDEGGNHGGAAAVGAWLGQHPPSPWYEHRSASWAEWHEAVSRWLQLADHAPPGDGHESVLDDLAEALASWSSAGRGGQEAFVWEADRGLRPPLLPQTSPGPDRASERPPVVVPTPGRPAALSSPEAAAEELRRAILHGHLAPGEHVRQPQWAEQLGVSRTVLREAFKILTGQHLLRHDPQSGYFVAKLNVSEMRQLYRLTALVEEEILRHIRWPTRNEIAALDQQFLAHYESFLVGDLISAIDHWREYLFHLYSLSSETFLAKEGIRLWEIATPYRMIVFTTMLLQDPSLSEIAIARQDQISALRARDLSRFIQSIIYDRLPAFENYATHSEIMAFFRRIPSSG